MQQQFHKYKKEKVFISEDLSLVIRLGYEPNVISSSISVLSEILALHPSRFSP